MKKRFFIILVVIMMAISFCIMSAGCGSSNKKPVVDPPDINGGGEEADPAGQFLDDIDISEGWSERGSTLNFHNGVVTVTNESTQQTYSSVIKRVTINTCDYPYIEFGITRVQSGSRWALNINAGDGEFSVYSERAQLGIFSVDLRKWPELQNRKNASIMLCFYACGDTPGNKANYDIDFIKTEKEAPFFESFDNLNAWELNGVTGNCTEGVAFFEGNGTAQCKVFADFAHWTSFDILPYQMDGSFSITMADEAGHSYDLCSDITAEAAQKVVSPVKTAGNYIVTIGIKGNVSFDSFEISATTLLRDDFSDESVSMAQWTEHTARIDVMKEGTESFARITEGNSKSDSGYVETPVYINATLFKYIKIDVRRIDSGTTWALKALYNGNEITLYNGSGRPGIYYANLGASGVSGNAKLDLRLYVIGNFKTVDFSEISIVSAQV